MMLLFLDIFTEIYSSIILIYTIKIAKESPNYKKFKSVTKWILICLLFIALYLLITFIYLIYKDTTENSIFFIILTLLQKLIILLLSYILTMDTIIIKSFINKY
jgi:hypothetical protein